MDPFLKFLESVSNLIGWLGILSAFLAALSVMRLAWVRLMREYQADQDRALKAKDEALATFRREGEGDKVRIKELDTRVAVAENRVMRQAAIIYDDKRYLRKLVKIIVECGEEVPERDRLSGELREERE